MKRRPSREALEREEYLTTDFGDLLSRLKPLNLDLEFPSPTQSISIRLPRALLNKIRVLADEQDVSYQSLIKMWLAKQAKSAA